MDSTQKATWEELRRRARTLQNSLDQCLNKINRLITSTLDNSTTVPGNDVALEKSEVELDHLLDELEQVVMDMSRRHEDRRDIANSTASSTSTLHTLQRQREIANDYRKQVDQVKQRLGGGRARRALLAGGGTRRGSEERDGTHSLLRERGHLDQSHQLIDMTLDQAYAVRQDLDEQRSMLVRSLNVLGHVTQRIPGMNYILRKIGYRRSRDQLILATVVAVCLFILVWYKLG
ncbi:protein transport protein gos1 [Dispira parvispora]|uniref:Protein transport protein gos1 n=1 Tax=Dispira parvispora TaxID=1520584 RepID=A0A9W8AS66_9FUNG|nr:protein transport protein gos1 [Dispira parvispora]